MPKWRATSCFSSTKRFFFKFHWPQKLRTFIGLGVYPLEYSSSKSGQLNKETASRTIGLKRTGTIEIYTDFPQAYKKIYTCVQSKNIYPLPFIIIVNAIKIYAVVVSSGSKDPRKKDVKCVLSSQMRLRLALSSCQIRSFLGLWLFNMWSQAKLRHLAIKMIFSTDKLTFKHQDVNHWSKD